MVQLSHLFFNIVTSCVYNLAQLLISKLLGLTSWFKFNLETFPCVWV